VEFSSPFCAALTSAVIRLPIPRRSFDILAKRLTLRFHFGLRGEVGASLASFLVTTWIIINIHFRIAEQHANTQSRIEGVLPEKVGSITSGIQ